MTRLGDLLQFGQLFKDCGNNYFAQIAHILGNFIKVVELFHFCSDTILGNFNRYLTIFSGQATNVIFYTHDPPIIDSAVRTFLLNVL